MAGKLALTGLFLLFLTWLAAQVIPTDDSLPLILLGWGFMLVVSVGLLVSAVIVEIWS